MNQTPELQVLHVLAALVTPTEGTVEIGGTDLTTLSGWEPMEKRLPDRLRGSV